MRDFEYLDVKLEGKVAYMALNRPQKANAVNKTLWFEIQDCIQALDELPEARVVVIHGNGKHFCAGIDFSLLGDMQIKVGNLPEGQKQDQMFRHIRKMQDAFSAVSRCRKPVISAIHGSCIGAGVDLIAGCDMRYATRDARFSIKEVDLGIVADVGSLQRLPYLIGDGLLRELAFSGRFFSALEAESMHLVNRTYVNTDILMEEVQQIANDIASKSPLTIRGVKQMINYGRDHDADACLDYVANKNCSMLLSADTKEALSAMMEKRNPTFDD